MAKRGPKKRVNSVPNMGVEPLKSMNIMVAGHRTSMRLEPSMWDALEDIARREGLTVNKLCTQIKERIDEQARRKGVPADGVEVTLTSAVRVFIAAYFRRACTEDGHSRAGHGGGDPFVGTPFELPQDELDQGAGESTAAAGTPPGFPTGKVTGFDAAPRAVYES
ncbi:ribbon-helix-helix domain-containing protein [Azospirillum sp. sgz302134]